MIRKGILFVFVLTIAAAALVGGAIVWVDKDFDKPGPLAESTTIVIQPGDSLRSISQDLAAAGIVAQADIFYWKTRLEGVGSQLKAGEYQFDPQISQRAVLRKLIDHDIVHHFVTIPEGLTSREIVELVSGLDGLAGTVTEIPAEGALLPETYSYSLGDTKQDVIGRMQRAAAALETEMWPVRAEGLPIDSWEEAVILASIVEKETGIAAERGTVAGVFVNRLNKGMRLQSDPTVSYGITLGEKPLGRKLRRADLDTDTPYNTYTRAGLPPGPICNPGRAALEAVLNPEDTDAIFFVADGTGGHAFAKTLAEHNRNVAKWRRLQKQQNQN
ncbi:MAG: endolytic transglycosylase MltG [Alphaproteobacteria bacterium]